MCVSGSWGFGVGVHSHSTVTPHGLLPLLSFYSLLLGDTALPQNATQAKHLSVPPPEPALRGYCDSSPLFQHTFSDPSPLCSNWQHSWFWTYVETWEILQHSFLYEVKEYTCDKEEPALFTSLWICTHTSLVVQDSDMLNSKCCFFFSLFLFFFFPPQEIVQQLWFYVYAYI